MDAIKNLKERVHACESQLYDLKLQIDSKLQELLDLQKEQRVLNDRLAATKDARAGIYDKWYRNHREDNSAYDAQWEVEKRLMLSEGYSGEWNVIDG